MILVALPDAGAMTPIPAKYWPLLALVALGLFRGINPAMGWLFAIALGLHRRSQHVVRLSLIPIAIGRLAICERINLYAPATDRRARGRH